MFDFIGYKILALYSLIFGFQHFVNTEDWQLHNQWKRQNEFYVFSGESTKIVEKCQANPQHFLAFPRIFNSIQEIRLDGYLIYSHGDLYTQKIAFQYSAPMLSCHQLLGAKKVQWYVYSRSLYFAHISALPYISKNRPIAKTLDTTFHAVCAVMLVFLSLFGLIIFNNRVSKKFLISFVMTGFFLGLYSFICSSGAFGILISSDFAQKLVDGILILGIWNLFLMLNTLKLVNIFFVSLLSFTSIFAMFLVVFGSNSDISQSGVNLNFLVYILCLISLGIRTIGRIREKSIREKLVVVLGTWSFIFISINDMLVTIGYWDTIMMFPVGASVLFVCLGFYVHWDIVAVYIERDQFKRELEKSYQEKLTFIQENAVAHSIANTVQRIAHDLKKPFNMLMLIFEQIKKSQLTPDLFLRFSQYLDETNQYVNSLIQNILVSEKPNRLEPVYLKEMAQLAWRQVTLLSKRKINFENYLQSDAILFVDKTKLQRLLINLLTNAIEAMESTSERIWIKSENIIIDERSFVEVVVGNQGSFIPPNKQEEIFTKFAPSDKSQGTGLGLTICWEIVRSHGGYIECRSDRQIGTEFVFCLPSAGKDI